MKQATNESSNPRFPPPPRWRMIELGNEDGLFAINDDIDLDRACKNAACLAEQLDHALHVLTFAEFPGKGPEGEMQGLFACLEINAELIHRLISAVGGKIERATSPFYASTS